MHASVVSFTSYFCYASLLRDPREKLVYLTRRPSGQPTNKKKERQHKARNNFDFRRTVYKSSIGVVPLSFLKKENKIKKKESKSGFQVFRSKKKIVVGGNRQAGAKGDCWSVHYIIRAT